jgi:hypothetical protein
VRVGRIETKLGLAPVPRGSNFLAWPGLACHALGLDSQDVVVSWTNGQSQYCQRHGDPPGANRFKISPDMVAWRRIAAPYRTSYYSIGARPLPSGIKARVRDAGTASTTLLRADENRLSKPSPSPARFDDD